MRKIIITTLILIFTTIATKPVMAVVDPRTSPNNKVGIHIIDESDLPDASQLVNSAGGDYGYVTFVIRSDQRDTNYWQSVFDKLRELHLIPIVRIASSQYDHSWHKLNPDEIDGWVTFLDSLNWIVQNRYVIVGNEPNHAKEWGGELNPEEYSDYFVNLTQKLKNESQDFFVMMAGMDASVPNSSVSMEEENYIQKVIAKNPDILNQIDGLASHSYPNPNFSGSPTDTGRGSLKTYEWEISLLERLGFTRDIPVFVTETGWAHSGFGDSTYKSPDIIAEYFKTSFESVWNDPKVVAVTPFLLRYKEAPFNMFSWKDASGNNFKFFDSVYGLNKVAGYPQQITRGEIIKHITPAIFIGEENKFGYLYIKNTGQSIWKPDQTFIMEDEGRKIRVSPFIVLSDVKPGENSLATFEVL
jgi:hypothetical protein